MLLVALSCLQGRPMRQAFDELLPLADGVQLTPGNLPTPGFAAHAARFVTRTHHGWAFDRRVVPVWSESGACLVDAGSVHPPDSARIAFDLFAAAVERSEDRLCLETMYPGHHLGCDRELAWAMDRGLPLAVDVSHLYIQRCADVLSPATWSRLQSYHRIDEIHVSNNDGRRDLHAPLTGEAFGLEWARERERAGTPLVFESYLHRATPSERRRQIDLIRG